MALSTAAQEIASLQKQPARRSSSTAHGRRRRSPLARRFYWYADRNGNGKVDPDEPKPTTVPAHTPRLLQKK
jgi:hypothetical protein